MCLIDDSEPWDVDCYKERTAVWPHRCGECGRTIEAGERYEVHNGLYDGHWTESKTCAHCQAARRWLNVVCGGWLFGYVWDEMRDHWTESDLLRCVPFGRLLVIRKRDPHFERTGVARIEALVTAALADYKTKKERLVHV